MFHVLMSKDGSSDTCGTSTGSWEKVSGLWNHFNVDLTAGWAPDRRFLPLGSDVVIV